MAAFLIFPHSFNTKKKAIVEHFKDVGILNYTEHKIGNNSLLLFQKIKINELNYIKNEKGLLASVGSFVYKGLSFKDGLTKLMEDIQNECYDVNQMYGIYTLVYYSYDLDKTTVITDPSLFKNIYVDFKSKIISSHWMPIVRVQPKEYNLNTNALLESVITGSLIAPDTYAVGIEKVCQSNFESLQTEFPEVDFRREFPLTQHEINSKQEGVKVSNQLLQNYFKDCNKLSEEYGSHVGLTGGFDSRLLMIHAYENLTKIGANSFYRPNSNEYVLAKNIAQQLNIEFSTHEGLNYNEQEFIDQKKAFLYLDGQVRSQNFINEPFSNPAYFNSLYSNYLVGFHGCGGEQYRNAERFPKRLSLKKYIRNEWLKKDTFNLIKNKEIKATVFNNVYDKIKNELAIQEDRLSLKDIKRFQNEVWNPSNRLTRVNALNQSIFYFAPFTETVISETAYELTSFLGAGNQYQLKILQDTKSKLNDIQTVHGYTINQGVPIKEKILNKLFSVLPRSLAVRFYFLFKRLNKKSGTASTEIIDEGNPLRDIFDSNNLSINKEVKNNIIASNYLFKFLEFKKISSNE